MSSRSGALDRLGPRHAEVRRLRALLRDRTARATECAFALEGPRVVSAALDRGARVETLYLGHGAANAFVELVQRVRSAGGRVCELREGVLEKVGSTRTPQPVLAVTPLVEHSPDELDGDGPVLVAVGVADPGNLGTMVRSAEATGAAGVVACGQSVDLHHPRTVRSSAGAIFGVPTFEFDEPGATLAMLAGRGRRCVGTVARGGASLDDLDLANPIAVVVGNEAHGLAPDVEAALDLTVSIPMAGEAESLNVAMAATVVLFELARRRRESPAGRTR